jgi:hypothetical protein
MTLVQYRKCAGALLLGIGILITSPAQTAEVLRVAYAGSMGVVMDRFIGPAFAKANGVEYQGIGQGAYGLARQLEGKLLQADVFVPITPGPIEILKSAGTIGPAVPVASTQMVVAYSPKSKFVTDFEAAAKGEKNWYEVLQTPGLRFGSTRPKHHLHDVVGREFLPAARASRQDSRRLSEPAADFHRTLVAVASGRRTTRRFVRLPERDALAPPAFHHAAR